jgi:hypothetical protein
MPESEPTCIGRVRHVLGATVTVSLDPDLAGVAPIWEGHLQPVGQVGSLVRIPQGPVNLLASVSLVGIAELTGPIPPATGSQLGDRWLQVQLIGEIDGLGRFQRGVSRYPGLDDPVHFTTPHELRAVYPPAGPERVRFAGLSAAPDVPVSLDAARLVTRHGAVVGSTGSGKTSAVVTIVQNFVRGGWESGNIVVVDPHGEYSPGLSAVASVRSVLGSPDRLLCVPFWALPATDILRAFSGAVDSQTMISRFSELVTAGRRSFSESATWLDLDPSSITADTPIPFNLHQVWFTLDYDNNATYHGQGGSGGACVEEQGDPAKLKPTRFQVHGLGNQAPFKGPLSGVYGTVPDRLRVRMSDPRYRFFQEPVGDPAGSDPLVQVIQQWLGDDRPVSVLDFSGVPAEVTDLAIGAVLQLLFEVAVRSSVDGIGRPRPVLIILEEAHRYLGDVPTARLARDSVNRIAREGRKYGVGILLVTQRPSELPATALAQTGTMIALRLTNSADQGTVKSALPDIVSGLADVLPSLRTGEAIVSGEAVVLPTRVVIDRPTPEPSASDPSLEAWRTPPKSNEIAGAIARWRGGQGEDDG